MSQTGATKWFHRFGPLSWYRDEWYRIDLELFGRCFGLIWLRAMGECVLLAGCEAVQRTPYGCPSAYRGGMHLRF